MSTIFKHTSVALSNYLFKDKIYEKGSGRLFRVLGRQLEELDPLSLTHQAYLNFIIDKNMLIATFDELTQLEGKHVNNNTVSKHIGIIKKAVGCDIENIPRQGYKLLSSPTLVDIKRYQLRCATQKQAVLQSTKTSKPVTLMVLALLLVLSLSNWFLIAGERSAMIKPFENTSILEAAQEHGVLSPDGQFLAFEHKKSLGQLTNLWLKNLTTGETIALTSAQIGIEDEISAFSTDGLRLLFHRTSQRNTCSINEIVFSQFNPIKFTETQLFLCEPGYKSINAEYGKDHDVIFFSDYNKAEQSYHIFRYDRDSNEVNKVVFQHHSDHGFYRVYPLAQGKELLLLSTDDWTSTVIHQLNLSTNKLQHLVDVPTALKSIGVDRFNRAFYYLMRNNGGVNDILIKFSLSNHQRTKIVVVKNQSKSTKTD